MLKVFSRLLGNEQFTDVLLATESKSIRCHKVVLSACSSYFEHLFLTFDEKNQIIILKDTSYDDILALVEFMYRGEINVGQVSYNKLIAWIFFILIFQNSYLKEKYWNFGVQIRVFFNIISRKSKFIFNLDFFQKFRQIEETSVLLSYNVNKFLRFFRTILRFENVVGI